MSTSNEAASRPVRTVLTVLLTNHQTAFLDEVALSIRRNTGKSITRSAMLRAMVGASLPYYKEWLHCRSEVELHQVITRRLQAGSVQQHQHPEVRPQAR